MLLNPAPPSPGISDEKAFDPLDPEEGVFVKYADPDGGEPVYALRFIRDINSEEKPVKDPEGEEGDSAMKDAEKDTLIRARFRRFDIPGEVNKPQAIYRAWASVKQRFSNVKRFQLNKFYQGLIGAMLTQLDDVMVCLEDARIAAEGLDDEDLMTATVRSKTAAAMAQLKVVTESSI